MESIATLPKARPFYTLHPDGSFDFSLHPGQYRAIYSPARFILILAGIQSGKTCSGPIWLKDEIERKGPGDYLCVAPNFPLMKKKVLPEFLRLFETNLKCGTYRYTDRIFQFHDNETKIFFGHGEDPDSLESATAKAAWLDEAGQKKFRMFSWEAIQGRLSIYQGRVLFTTTPYDLGWLKQEIYDRWKAGDKDYDVVNFDSLMNPMFPVEEYERARRTLPGWRFRMRYQGQFERPAGMIYDCFDEKMNKCPRFQIPSEWKRYMGNDFGAVNTAAVYLAEDPGTKILYAYREYWKGGLTAKQHTAAMLDKELGTPSVCVGGAQSEDNWRDEFKAAGLPIREPDIKEVEVGINRVYGEFASGSLVIFDDLKHTLDNILAYSRELDDLGQPTERIEEKEKYHLCFVAGTLVETLNGPVPIENVNIGDMVLTRQGFKSVAAEIKTDYREVYRIGLSDGRELIGTANHPVWTDRNGFCPIVDLLRGDKIMVCEKKLSTSADSRIIDTQSPNGVLSGNTSGTTFPSMSGCSCIGRFGRLTTNSKYLKDFTSTTLTKILEIMIRVIFNCFHTRTICDCTTQGIAQKLRLSTWKEFVIWAGSGIARKPATLTTVSERGRGQTVSQALLSRAWFAERSEELRRSARPAAITVQLHAERNQELITSRGRAGSVSNSSSVPNTSYSTSVGVVVQTVQEHGSATVYNLSVSGQHEYFANGVLVSNCDALRYIVGYLRGKPKRVWVR